MRETLPSYGYYIRSWYLSKWFASFDLAMSYGSHIDNMGYNYTIMCCKTGSYLE